MMHDVPLALHQLSLPGLNFSSKQTDATASASFVSTGQFPLNSPPTGSIKFEDTPNCYT
jgi:hypothetical protein